MDPVFWNRSDSDTVFKIRSDLDSVYKIWSDPDPVFKIWSDPETFSKFCQIRIRYEHQGWVRNLKKGFLTHFRIIQFSQITFRQEFQNISLLSKKLYNYRIVLCSISMHLIYVQSLNGFSPKKKKNGSSRLRKVSEASSMSASSVTSESSGNSSALSVQEVIAYFI